MKQEDFLGLKSFKVHNGQVLIPAQIETQEWIEQLPVYDEVFLKEINPRDSGFHKAYFMILGFIWDRLNLDFRKKVPKKFFYMYLKTLQNEFKIVFVLENGREFVEYNSISFQKMNQTAFREYFNNQLSTIYEEVLIPMEQDYLMDEINEKFESIISKLI
jgi:hypothetical protein